MPIFIYKAKKGPQEMVEGTVEAGSKEAAVSKVEWWEVRRVESDLVVTNQTSIQNM